MHGLALQKFKALHGVVTANVAKKCKNAYFGFQQSSSHEVMLVNGKCVLVNLYFVKKEEKNYRNINIKVKVWMNNNKKTHRDPQDHKNQSRW